MVYLAGNLFLKYLRNNGQKGGGKAKGNYWNDGVTILLQEMKQKRYLIRMKFLSYKKRDYLKLKE